MQEGSIWKKAEEGRQMAVWFTQHQSWASGFVQDPTSLPMHKLDLAGIPTFSLKMITAFLQNQIIIPALFLKYLLGLS